MKKGIVTGVLLIIMGAGLFAYYDQFIRSEREAAKLLTEAKFAFERDTGDSVNYSIKLFSRVISQYPGTDAGNSAYFYIAQGYEKLGLNRQAYLKYIYLLKNGRNNDPAFRSEVKARLARLKVHRRYTEEGIHQLLGLLNNSHNREFRSRVYSELGHTYLNMKAFRKSKRMFDIALSENGDNEEAILGKARAYKHLGMTDDAYDTYEYYFRYYGNFSRYAPDVKRSYIRQVYRSGHYSYRKGKYSSAISYFNRILQYFPGHRKSENSLYWIGECYLGKGHYNSAINYFSRTLANGFNHKNQDARIKKGYTYFLLKRFDLAAREFQIYINSYPHGRFITTARRWKEMSTREMLYRIQNKMIMDPDEEDEKENKEDDEKISESSYDGSSYDVTRKEKSHDSDSDYEEETEDDVEYENVAEL